MDEINNVCPKFSSIDNTAFKRKVYDTCLLFAMKNYQNIQKCHPEDMFPSNQYYTLEEQLNVNKNAKKTIEPPKKNVNISKKSNEKVSRYPKIILTDSADSIITQDAKPKEKKKAYPLIFNRNAKTSIDFIIGRFLWEVFYIEPSDCEECPDSKENIENYILTNVPKEFTKGNISQLIIHSVKAFRPSDRIIESYGLDKELRSKFDFHMHNNSFANLIAEYTINFLKLLMIFFTNKFWLEKSQTVNIKTFETILRYIEISIPIKCETFSKGLFNDLSQYDKIVYNQNDSSDISIDTDTNKKSEKKPVKKPVKKPDKKPDKKPAKKPAKKPDKKPDIDKADEEYNDEYNSDYVSD